MRRIWKWWISISTNRAVWRVTYKDGRMTRLLRYNDAWNLKKCFGGKLWVDYENGYF